MSVHELPKITIDDWRAEIDKVKQSSKSVSSLTEEQVAYIDYCRGGNKILPYRIITKMFNKQFDMNVTSQVLRIRYIEAKDGIK